jgi:uncharacterized protein
MPSPVVVLDTNVQISGLLWRGKPYQCLLPARSNVIQAVYCTQILAELSKKLRDKFNFSENRVQAVLTDIKRYAQKVEISAELHVVTADPDDDKFIECAIVAKATTIISSDRHLLALGAYQDIQILSPEQFISQI